MPSPNSLLKWLGVAALVAVGSYLAGSRARPVAIPTIVTQYDTVKVIDTAWITKLKHDTIYKQNIVERYVYQKPETVKVFTPLNGLLAVFVPQRLGDTTRAFGFKMQKPDSNYLLSYWEYDFWTTGPLRSMRLLSTGGVATDFYDPPETCDKKCKLKIGCCEGETGECRDPG